MINANTKFNNSGQRVTVGDPFNKRITFQDILDGKDSYVDKAGIKQMMHSIGASEQDMIARTTGQVNIVADAHIPVFAYGLGKRLTVAIAIPVVHSSTNIDVGNVQANQNFINGFRKALKDKGADDKVVEFNKKMIDPISEKVKEDNYLQMNNENKTLLGDIKLVSKYNFFENETNRLTLSLDISLPTGKQADVNKVVDISGGDGQTDVGFGLAHDLQVLNILTLSYAAAYTFQFADHTAKRIPTKSTSSLSPDIDDNTWRDLGDNFLIHLATKFHYQGFHFDTAYSFQYKERDVYAGNKYEKERYEWSSKDTRQNMHTIQVSLGYDTITLYKKKQFAAPLSVTLNHTRVVAGKNVVNDPLTSLDFSMFF